MLDTEKQEGIKDITDAFTAAAAAETQDDTDAAFRQVGAAHRDKVIGFMVENEYALPSATYLQQRIERKAGEKSCNHKTTITQIDNNATDNNAHDNNAHDNYADVKYSNAGRANP